MLRALRRPWVGLLVLALCLAALAWTLRRLEPARLLAATASADPWWLSLSALPVLGRFLLWGVKWQRILGRREPVPYGAGLRILVAGTVVNLTTPTAKLAGGVVRAVLLNRRRGWPLLEAYGRALADQVTNVLGHLLLYALVGLAAAASLPPGRLRAALFGSGAAVLVALGGGLALRGTGWRLARRPEVGQLLARLVPERLAGAGGSGTLGERAARVLYPLLGEGGRVLPLMPDLLWAAASFACLCVANAMVLRALGIELALPVASAVVLIGYFAGIAVGIGGGIGVTEAALTALYLQLGVPTESAVAGALLHRAVFYTVTLGLGGLALVWDNRLAKRRRSAG